MDQVQPLLSKIIDNVENDLSQYTLNVFDEANTLLKKKIVWINDISNMSYFLSLFGREQCYLSLTNEQL